ncbi:hypothetical protein [Nocardia cyriacigeorgica]|uniref:hypothetical protein n=1 Tax=Nocardia cyriacigeorgica TaxID=135487 RepID=UPI0024587894|nr:hypothetical protein [Nocardia cyriacigeorgica]
MTNADAVLAAEYRAFVQSLHKDTIDTIVATQTWFTGECFRIVSLGGYDPDREDGPNSEDVAQALVERWRREIHPRLMTVIHGHPDPDVRHAADILAKRLWSIVLILDRPRTEEREKSDETSVAIHLVHDGFMRTRRAAYMAPFRVERPEPRYSGYEIGRAEPGPREMLKLIRDLQDAGALEKDNDQELFGSRIPEAVAQLSDILFMPEEERSALFRHFDVEEPIAAPPEPEDAAPFQFGFTAQ